MGVELVGGSARAAARPPGRCRKQTTDSSGTSGIASKSSDSAQRRASRAARSSLASMSRAKPVGPEVLPGHPELERAPAAGALEAELVEVELVAVVVVGPWSGVDRGLAAAVVLGRPAAEHLAEVRPVADQQAADVVGLEEPLVRVDGDRVGALEVRRRGPRSRADSRAAPP